MADHQQLKVLFVEDDPAVRFGGEQALNLAGIHVEAFGSAEAVRPHVHPYFPGILVADVKLPGTDGLQLLDEALRIDPTLPVILVTGHGDIGMAVQAMKAGAYDFIEKPFASDYLISSVQRALEKRQLTFEIDALRCKLEDRQGIEGILIGHSILIENLRRSILKLSNSSPDVIVTGETGTGKELVARCLHQYSRLRDRHFVPVNCAAIPEQIFESEFFGHEPGAFTGAQKRRIGKFEHAAGGTLLLDEIELLPLPIQTKLLRALQERQIERLGSNELLDVEVRIVAATKTDMAQLVEQHRFRQDLYYRLDVVRLEVPPLRDRREDIPLLFEHFALQAAQRYRQPAPMATDQLVRELMAHSWPGNVRELRNVADRFVLGVLDSPYVMDGQPDLAVRSLADQVDDFERSIIVEQLRRQHGGVVATSEALGIPKKTLYDKIRRHEIMPESFR
jgi:two-component system, NtrC family, C4-dicarboxylate transport response regulator DctD